MRGVLESDAVLDVTGRYRYSLTRGWNPAKPRILFVMLNPSTADAMVNDPTIRRCLAFAGDWGFGSLEVVNLFAIRATDPKALGGWPLAEAIGPDNDRHIVEARGRAETVVLAWGAEPLAKARAAAVVQLLRPLPIYCLGKTADGSPRHPLYLKKDTRIESWDRGYSSHAVSAAGAP